MIWFSERKVGTSSGEAKSPCSPFATIFIHVKSKLSSRRIKVQQSDAGSAIKKQFRSVETFILTTGEEVVPDERNIINEGTSKKRVQGNSQT